MNIFIDHYEFLKNEADLLLKHARLGDAKAVARLQSLSSFTTLSTDDINALNHLQLKHALNVIAGENGYKSWSELKHTLNTAAETSPLAEIHEQFYPQGFTTYWNIWFAKYSQAKKVLNEGKGFLLPYKNQYFIVEEHFVDSIGLPHTLPEWNEIGNDWIHPKNVKAWLKLNDMYVHSMKER